MGSTARWETPRGALTRSLVSVALGEPAGAVGAGGGRFTQARAGGEGGKVSAEVFSRFC